MIIVVRSRCGFGRIRQSGPWKNVHLHHHHPFLLLVRLLIPFHSSQGLLFILQLLLLWIQSRHGILCGLLYDRMEWEMTQGLIQIGNEGSVVRYYGNFRW